MGVAPNAVLVPEEIHLFFIGVGILEIGKNAAFPTRNTAASGHGGVDLVLGDKLLDRRYFRHLRGKGGAGQGQIFQVSPNLLWLVVVEPQQVPVLLIGRPECCIFFCKGLAELRAFQLLGKPRGFFRETAPWIVGKAGQIPGFSGFIAEIVIQIPELFRKEGTFIALGLGQLHIGGKLAGLQKLADTLGGALPGNDLGGLVITGRLSVRQVDAVLGIPYGNAANPVAAGIEVLQIGCDLGGGLLLFKSCHNAFTLPVRVASQPQHMVDVGLGKRKSRGCLHILCFVYSLDLFRFGEEQV